MPVKINITAAAGIGCLLLWGCDFFSTRNFEPHPAQLNPDTDVFSNGSQRAFLWKEGWTVGARDTAMLPRTLRITNLGDTTINGIPLHRVRFSADDGAALPASLVSSLGFNPSKLLLDSATIPDPGPALGFPLTPQIGWRSEITSGDLQIVRELTGFDTLDRPEGLVETWAFTDTYYWLGSSMAVTRYSMGRGGLLHLTAQRTGFNANGDSVTGILWREVTAQ
jgi:hypothetical protein